jgi:hypothetical protein
VVEGVISEEELSGAALRTFRGEDSDLFPLESEIPETLDNLWEIHLGREPSLISPAPVMRADGPG